MEKIISYLAGLKKNNNREWYIENKSIYNEARSIFLTEIQTIIDKLQFLDTRLSNLKAQDCMFRIYRDIRFSKDKTPYKTYFSAYMAHGGRKSQEAGYYVQISDDESFIGAGTYSPEKEELKAIRQEILFQPESYMTIINECQNKGYTLMTEGKLKTGPKDFPKDSPHIDLIKNRHYIFSKAFSSQTLLNDRFSETVVGHFQSLLPFTSFLNTAMEFKGND